MPPTRSGGKKPANAYNDETRERALEVMRTDGLAAAHAATGVPKGTLSRWGKEAGIDLGKATARSRAASSARAAQLAESTVGRLEYLIDLSTRSLIRRLEADADLVELDDEDLGVWSDELERFVPPEDAKASRTVMRRSQLMRTGEPTRDVVGVLTRAVHDLQLLRGEATERGEVQVQFAVPRPDTSRVPVPEVELSGAGAS